MPLVDGNHVTRDGRRYRCGAPEQAKPVEYNPDPGVDVSAILQAAVDRECAPPWVRHPEPWDNVVVRRVPRQ